MGKLKNLWNNFKAEPDVWFFCGFLLTFTLSVRKVIQFYPIAGQFNEYSGIYLYLSDIFLILTLVGWGISILRHNDSYLSIFRHYFGLNKPIFKLLMLFNLWFLASILWSANQEIAIFRSVKIFEFSLLFLYTALRIVPRGTFYGAGVEDFNNCHPELASGSSQLDSNSIASFSTYRNRKAGMTNNVPRGTLLSEWNILRRLFQIIIFFGLFQAVIGIWQFFSQTSIGLFWLQESLISPDLPGVAKIILNGEKYIRAYGLFPHPNIFGGFLIFSLISTWIYFNLFHSQKNASRLPMILQMFHACPKQKCSTPARNKNVPRGTFLGGWNILGWMEHSKATFKNLASLIPGSKIEQVTSTEAETECNRSISSKLDLKQCSTWNTSYAFFVIFGIQLFALILSFSKSAILGLIISLVYILGKICPRSRAADVPRGTNFSWQKIRSVARKFWKEALIIILIAFIGLNWLNIDWNTFLTKSWNERGTYLIVSRGTISNNPITGIGAGQFVLEMDNNVPRGTLLEPWQYQPVHNVFLLIWSELGLIGLILFCAFLYYLFRKPAESRPLPAEKEEGSKKSFPQQYSVYYTLLRGFLLALLFIAFFDHYLWDIQQGQILLWLALGFFFGLSSFSGSAKITA